MGYYINVPEGKEKWLEENRTKIYPPGVIPAYEDVPTGEMLVCLFFNTDFTAAAIVYSKAEYEEFKSYRAHRLMVWQRVPTERLIQFLPEDFKEVA